MKTALNIFIVVASIAVIAIGVIAFWPDGEKPGKVYPPSIISSSSTNTPPVVSTEESLPIPELKERAAGGDRTAQFNLGLEYVTGKAIPKNEAAAAGWYRRAAEQGEVHAQVNLGKMYADGRGVAQDDAIAAKWYRQAAEQGNRVAQYNLGLAYANGKGVPRDDSQAVKYYLKAAHQNYAPSQVNLSAMYFNGKGVRKDIAESYIWMAAAGINGNKAAENSSVTSLMGLTQPEARAAVQSAAERGIPELQYLLGSMRELGVDGRKDFVSAFRWYIKAAKHGITEAEYNVGVAYRDGKGVKVDSQKAVEWFEKAAMKNLHYAQGNLAIMYATGKGVEKDMVRSHAWGSIGANQGNLHAKKQKLVTEKKMTPNQISQSKRLAKQLLKQIEATQKSKHLYQSR